MKKRTKNKRVRSEYKKPEGEEKRLPTTWRSGIADDSAILDTLGEVDDQVFVSAERYRAIEDDDDGPPVKVRQPVDSNSPYSYLNWLRKNGYKF